MKESIQLWVRRIYVYVKNSADSFTLIGLAICCITLFGLSELFEEVLEKEAFWFDTKVSLAVHQLSNPLFDQVMLLITRLGNPPTVVGIVLSTLIWLLWKHRYLEAKYFSIACVGGLILTEGLKRFFEKPRPTLWTQLITETSFSFPSGHALGSFIVYGFLAVLLARSWQHYSRLIYGVSTIVIGSVGFSRIYLGVHWLTDIIAGFGVGFLWLCTCIFMLKIQDRRRSSRS